MRRLPGEFMIKLARSTNSSTIRKLTEIANTRRAYFQMEHLPQANCCLGEARASGLVLWPKSLEKNF